MEIPFAVTQSVYGDATHRRLVTHIQAISGTWPTDWNQERKCWQQLMSYRGSHRQHQRPALRSSRILVRVHDRCGNVGLQCVYRTLHVAVLVKKPPGGKRVTAVNQNLNLTLPPASSPNLKAHLRKLLRQLNVSKARMSLKRDLLRPINHPLFKLV